MKRLKLLGVITLATVWSGCDDVTLNEPATAPVDMAAAARGPKAQEVEPPPPTPYVLVFKTEAVPAGAAEQVAAAGGELVRTIPQVGLGLALSTDPEFAEKVGLRVALEAVDPASTYALPSLGEPEVLTMAVEKKGPGNKGGGKNEPTSHAEDPNANDVFYPTYGWNIRRVNAPAAWEVTTGSHETVVAVIDGGIAWNHPDLAPNVVFAACFSLGVECTPYPAYTYHGTHVAGTVAAAFGHGGVIGVGPDLGLASYSVFEPIEGCGICAFSFSSWSSLVDAADRGFEVANLSLGGYGANFNSPSSRLGWSRVTNYALRNDLVVVASAGNGDPRTGIGIDLNGPIYHTPSDANGVISVGATGIRPTPVYPSPDAYDVKTTYSNYGAALSLVAPGGDIGGAFLIASTGVFPDPECAATASCPIAYFLAGGTSMASPHVAGVVGLIRDAHPHLTANEARALVKDAAQDLGDRQLFGHGMVDAGAAVR